MIEIKHQGTPCKLSKLMGKTHPELSYNYLQKLLKIRDVKVNGERINSDVTINNGDVVQVYANDKYLYTFSPNIVFEDDNLLIAHKPRGIETAETQGSYESQLNEYFQTTSLRAVHRLDTNTEGLVMFAKNKKTENELLRAIKENEIEKFYMALVDGSVVDEAMLTAYLRKDKGKSRVFVTSEPQRDSVKIITYVKPLDYRDGTTLVEVGLVTGKTHQIRAHLAHIGFPVIGDGKYGKNDTNRRHGEKKQCLTAYKLVFKLQKSSFLCYLNQKRISIKPDFN